MPLSVSDLRASVHSRPAPSLEIRAHALRADCRRVADSDTEGGCAVETQNVVPQRQHRMPGSLTDTSVGCSGATVATLGASRPPVRLFSPLA